MLKPELLIRSVKTKSTLWWSSGTKTRIAMMTTTPNTWTNTEMLLVIASRWVRMMLIVAWIARMIAKSRKVSPRMCSESPKLTPKISTP